QAAERLVDEVMSLPLAAPDDERFEAEVVGASVGAANGEFWNLWSNGDTSAQVTLPADGRYRIRARAWAAQGGPDPARLGFLVDGIEVGRVDVLAANSSAAATYETETMLKKGVHSVGVAFLNDYYDPNNNIDRNLFVDWFEYTGPLDLPPPVNPLRDRIVIC